MHCTLLSRQSVILAVNLMHGRGLSNKLHPWLQPKKAKVRLYCSVFAFTVWLLFP